MSNTRPWVAHYEADVPATIEIPEMLLQDILVSAAQKYPNHIGMRLILKYLPLGIVIQSRMTYRELNEATDRFAAALHDLGVRHGDCISLMLPNLPQQVIAYFGALKAGATIVNTNPTYTPRELAHQLVDSGAETIVVISGLYERVIQAQEHAAQHHGVQLPMKNIIVTDVPDSLGMPFRQLAARQVKAAGLMVDVPDAANVHRFYDLLKRYPPTPPQIDHDPDSVILLQYTGGTTGVPKAAALTHRNLVSNIHQTDTWFAKVEYGQEKLLGALPFFHVYGMTVGMLMAFGIGAELIIVPDPRNVEHVMDVITNEHVTLFPGVPTLYNAIVNHNKETPHELHSIKACLSGGAALPVEVARQFESLTGGRLVEGYGLSECSPVATANPIYGDRRFGSIGLPVPNTEVAIFALDPDEHGNYARLPVGEEGEICIHGPQVMQGYWNKPEETELTIDKEGWLHTGDIGKMDEDGYFYVVDRKKDLIIASGYNVVPREVEEVLFTHHSVMEAAVAGVPDARRGETVKAYVVLQPGTNPSEDEIRTFCRESLAPYKVPTHVEFREELPKSQVGKVLRRVLVEEEKARQQEAEEV